jgi:hypothetical protein
MIDRKLKLNDQGVDEVWLQAARWNAEYTYEVLIAHPKIRGTHNSGNLFENTFTDLWYNNSPIPLLAYWGAGPRKVPGQKDDDLLEYFQGVTSAVGEAHQFGAELTLFLADSHAVNNHYIDYSTGQPRSWCIDYLKGIENNAADRNISVLWLSDLYAEHGLTLPTPDQPRSESALEIYNRNDRHGQYRRGVLIDRVKKHSANGNTLQRSELEEEALKYLDTRLGENPMLERLLLEDESPYKGGALITLGSQDAMAFLTKRVPHIFVEGSPPWFHIDDK